MFQPVLPLLANLFVLGFALDGALSLLDEGVRLATGSTLLQPPRELLAVAVLLASVPLYFLLAVTPRLPLGVFLPLLLSSLWLNTGAAPLPLLVGTRHLGLFLAVLQLAIFSLCALGIRRTSGGRSWLFTPESLAGPRFSASRTAGFAAATVLLVLPLWTLYGVIALATWVQLVTHSFVSFDLEGLSLADRRYGRDGQEIRLVGMVHIGEDAAYRELVASFSSESTVVLAEGVTDVQQELSAPLSYGKMAERLGLEPQGDLGSYLAAGEDGEAPAWPHLRHADVDMSVFAPETQALLARAAAVWDSDEPLAAFARLFDVSVTEEEWALVTHDLIERRNQHLLGEIGDALESYERVIVPWGALHLPGIEQEITERGFSLLDSTRRRLLSWVTIAAALR